MSNLLTIEQLNALTNAEFRDLFKNIVENYSEIAEYLAKHRPFRSLNEIFDHIRDFLRNLNVSEKEKILRLHPDLAGKLADDGGLTDESKLEQQSAGLDRITVEEKRHLRQLNEIYKSKFHFPFVICARKNKLHAIIDGLKRRTTNEKMDEINAGVEQVQLISQLRVENIVRDN